MAGQSILLRSLTSRPLQASKLIGIGLGLLFGSGGLLRRARSVEGPLRLADLLVPLIGLALVGIIVAETVATGYSVLRSENTLREQAAGRVGYILVRCLEAGVAVGGLLVIGLQLSPVDDTLPVLVSVDLMSGLVTVGGCVVGASLVRSVTDCYWGGCTA